MISLVALVLLLSFFRRLFNRQALLVSCAGLGLFGHLDTPFRYGEFPFLYVFEDSHIEVSFIPYCFSNSIMVCTLLLSQAKDFVVTFNDWPMLTQILA